MTEQVVTTRRERLTPRQLLKLFEDNNGICCICGFPIDADKKWMETLKSEKGFVDEHRRALGLGGSNKLQNRGVAHIHCADVKTHDQDMPAINKAKDQKMRAIGAVRPVAKLASAPFARSERSINRQPREPVAGMTAIARRFRGV